MDIERRRSGHAPAKPTGVDVEGYAPKASYDGDGLHPQWGYGLPEANLRHLVPYLPPADTFVEFAGEPRVFRRGDAYVQEWRPWYATPQRVVVAEFSRAIAGGGDGRMRPQEPWRFARIDSYPFDDPGVWRHDGLPGRPVGSSRGTSSSQASQAQGGDPLAALHRHARLADTWALLPVEAHRMAERLCPAAQAQWADGIALLHGHEERDLATEKVRYVRVAPGAAVALIAARSRALPLRSDASDAGLWQLSVAGGPYTTDTQRREVPSSAARGQVSPGSGGQPSDGRRSRWSLGRG